MDASELEGLWKTILERIKLSVSAGTYATYFPHSRLTSIKRLDNGRQLAEVTFSNAFLRENVELRYWGVVKDAVDSVTGVQNDLIFQVGGYSGEARKKADETAGNGFEDLFSQPKREDSVARKAHLREDFTFESFAVSSSNQMAWAAASAVARSPGITYNPLFLYGGTGVGKTHLMQAIGHEIIGKDPERKVIYCAGEEFTNELVESIRTNSTARFKEKYRTVDALLLDDIQFIAGKKETQEEFFHTFNVILREGGQVVLTSDRPPQEIEKLEDRLRTRFEAGLVVDVPLPDLELRAAILLIKARQKKIEFPSDLATMVAELIERPRQLEGFLVKIQNELAVRQRPIDKELVEHLLGKQTKETAIKKLVSPQDVISMVANYFQVGVSQLKGERRSQPLAFQRQILMFVLNKELGLPLTEVGRLIGDRDHTTVLHAKDKLEAEMPTNLQLQRDLASIKKMIYE